MKPKVVMQFELRMGAADRVREVADVVIDQKLENIEGADVLVIGGAKTDGTMMDKAGPNLKLICRPGIGVDSVDIPAASARGIMVINTPDAPSESTAEHAVALLMAVAKRVMVGDMFLRQNSELGRTVERGDTLGTELLNRNLGVLGYGRIGRRVAEICALGLKMNVTVHDPYVDLNMPTPDGVALTDDLDGLLASSKFVTVHVPLLPGTRHYMDERKMRLIPQGGYLINAARGPIVDEKALIRLLEEGHFAGAGLDVFDPEPPEADNPLLKMKNVVVTPHIASGTDQGVYDMMHGTADQIMQVLKGEQPPHLLDPSAWPGRVGS